MRFDRPRLWLIRKLGGVPEAEFEALAVDWRNEISETNRLRNELQDARHRKEKADWALARFMDRIKIDPDGYHRPEPMEFPMAQIAVHRQIAETCRVISITARPEVIRYTVAEDFGEPMGRLLERGAIAAEKLGRDVATETKAAFGIAVAKENARRGP